MNYKFARRSFLSSIGASAMLLPLLRNIEAQAQGMAAPKRLLVILKPVGVVRADWIPTGSPTPQGITSFDWKPISKGLDPLRSRMVLIDNLKHVAESTSANAANERNGGNETHEGGIPAMMCGVPCVGRIGTQDHVAGGPSFDQIFLKRSPVLGGAGSTTKTPYGSLEVGTDTRSDRDEISPRVMSYDDPVSGEKDLSKFRRPRYPEIRPVKVFDRLFGTSVIPDATPDQLAAIRAQKKSLVDFMRRDLNRLSALVPSGEKVKIDAHVDAIQKLETSINSSLMSTGTGGSGGTTAVSCTKPTTPGTFPDNPDYWYDSRSDKASYHPHESVGRLHLQLIKAAFQCDLTRVATFMWSPGTNYVVFGGLYDGMPVGGHHVKSHGDGLGAAWLSQIDAWYAKTTTSALQEFVTPELGSTDTNNTLLDNMVALYASEVGQASHNWANVPTVVFGGKNLGISGGRFMKASTSRPFNDLWLALAPAYGITDMTKQGGSTQSTGPLPYLRST